MRSALPLATLTIAVAVLLSGCLPQDPDVIPPPEPSTEPVFASDEEALAAATDAYKAYLAMSDLIAQEGGKDPERLAPFVTEGWLQDEIAGFEALHNAGRRIVGSSAFTNPSLQQYQHDDDGTAFIVIYVCSDETEVQVFGADGADVTPPELDVRWPSEITLESRSEDTKQLVVAGEYLWDRHSDC